MPPNSTNRRERADVNVSSRLLELGGNVPVYVPVYYDFASTICYVAHRVMDRIRDDVDALGIDLVWRPIDLGRLGGWRPGAVVDGAPRENAQRVARELEVAVRMPPVWLDSRSAHAVAIALAGTTTEISWRERVWCAVFEEGRDIGDPAEIERLGLDLGIDVGALAVGDRVTELRRATDAARDEGVTGAPTFVLGRFPFAGIQEPATMLDLLARYVKKQRSP